MRTIIAVACLSAAAHAADAEWKTERESRPIVRQAADGASGRFVLPALGAGRAVRCAVELSPGTRAAGIAVFADDRGAGGISCLVGCTGEMRGFAVRDAAGKVLWADEWAPWLHYQPCIVEAVMEGARLRAQLLDAYGKELISQSDWIEVDAALAARDRAALEPEGGIARFWAWKRADAPLAAPTPDAPNRRRIVPGPGSPWIVSGPKTWMRTAAGRLRQTARVERATALDRDLSGVHRTWTARVKVSPGAGGAGLFFACDEKGERRLGCWLGGTFGAGCLMLYHGDRALWASAEGKWRYDREYVLVAETRPGEARVRLLEADGKTVIAESPAVPAPRELTDAPGIAGFHTWKGPAEFWDYEGAPPAASVPPAPPEGSAAPIGGGWAGVGAGWQLLAAGPDLVHRGDAAGFALHAATAGAKGPWRCEARPRERASAALLFQASADRKAGFALRLKEDGGRISLRLDDLSGRTLWTGAPFDHTRGIAYVLEGKVLTDRVRGRLLSPDGKVLADTGEVYVSQANDERRGALGVEATGRVTFARWSFAAE